MPMQNSANLRAVANHFGSRFVKALSFDSADLRLEDYLAEPAFSLGTRLPLRREAGGLDFLHAWRIRFPEILGPCKGGVRFYPGVSEESLTTLAARILVKCAANGLPHGGAAGGVAVDPKSLSQGELQSLAESYVLAYADVIGQDRDILSPDLGTNAQVMAWMSLKFNEIRKRSEPGAINGKPLAFGGVHGRPGATASGARIVLEELLKRRHMAFKGLTAAVQGFGAAGGPLALELAEHGVKVIAVSDSSGGWRDPRGLEVSALLEAKEAGTPLARQTPKRAQPMAPEEVLEAPADLVIAAAAGGQVTAANSPRLQCRFVVEIANAAVTDEAESILESKGIEVVPDIIVNSGGITVSHFEWVQNKSGKTMSAAEVRDNLGARMLATAERWLAQAEERKVSLTVAAQLLAIGRIREALKFWRH